MSRKPISKKTRFEVFKRDGFSCQYCGAHPPEIILHIDHIHPVASGGGNEIDNLITACAPCNQGKGARSLSNVPQSLKEKAADVSEREEQLRGYQEVMEARRLRLDGEMWRVAEILEPGSSEKGFRRDYLQSIRRFVETLGVHAAIDAAEIAAARMPWSEPKRFRYFCGICWNRLRDR